LNLDNLKLFRDIAQTRSISKGAGVNTVSQSAASQHLQEVERELGATLLDRSTRPLTVTAAGHLYLDFCRDVLRRREDFEAALGALKQETGGTVRVASIYSVGLSEMSELEQEFSRRYPDARIEVEYLRPEKVYESVMSDIADLGLVSYPESTRDVKAIPWRQEEMVVAASPYDPLASLEGVRVEDLSGVDFIGFDEDLPIQQAIRRFFEEHGSRLQIALHFDNLQMIKEAVTHRLGVSIMPVRVMQAELTQGRLVAIPLTGAPLFRPLGIVHRRKKRFSGIAQGFLELLQENPAPVLVGIE
jgi:LysR family transcriptional regulator, transcriptional activator of the cysJI operon